MRDGTTSGTSAKRAGAGGGRGLSWGSVFVGILAVTVAAVCIRLGFWQLDRLEQRRERNAALQASRALPPLELEEDTLRALLRDPERYRYRRVRVRGEYLVQAEAVQRGRTMEGQPGVYLFTPLRLADSRWAVLVNRGWAPSPDGMSVNTAPLAESGAREVMGFLQTFPSGVDDARVVMLEVDGERVSSIQRLDPDFFRSISPAPLLPLYLQRLSGGDAPPQGVRPVPLPEMDDGPHLGYAFQWFSFAAIALLGPLILLFRSRRSAR